MTVRAAAVLSWVYAAGFGIPAVPVAIHLRRTGTLPTFLDLFPMYGGPWFDRLSREQFTALLAAFLLVEAAVAGSAFPLWRRRRSGAVLNLALLPVEAVLLTTVMLLSVSSAGILKVLPIATARPPPSPLSLLLATLFSSRRLASVA